MTKMYEIKSGRYAGMWHVREYRGAVNGCPRYFHVGRYKTQEDASIAAHAASERSNCTRSTDAIETQAERINFSNLARLQREKFSNHKYAVKAVGRA